MLKRAEGTAPKNGSDKHIGLNDIKYSIPKKEERFPFIQDWDEVLLRINSSFIWLESVVLEFLSISQHPRLVTYAPFLI